MTTPRRMIRVRQLDRSVGECTAALGLILLKSPTWRSQAGAGLPDRRVGGGERIPGSVEFLRELDETRSDSTSFEAKWR